jgi:leucine dehydrogenase
MAEALDCRLVVSGANGPYAADAETILAEKATVVPDVLSNAGAVIVDSIERYNPWAWSRAEPDSIYRMVERQIRDATVAYLDQLTPSSHPDEPRRPCGLDYDAPLLASASEAG